MKADTPVTPATAPGLLVRGARKSYAGMPALRGVDLSVVHGSIHALSGGNGSGKSTLIKLLAAVESADAGSVVTHEGESALSHLTPTISHRLGLRFVHQDPGIVGELTVGENVGFTLGFPRRAGAIAWRRLHRRVDAILEHYEVDARSTDRADRLSPATRTMVAIARALSDDMRQEVGVEVESLGAASRSGLVLVLDEPTASLPSHEVDLLLDSLRRRAAAGQTILYVSHRLDEVVSLASRITVLRDGALVADLAMTDVTQHRIAELMAGEPIEEFYPAVPAPPGPASASSASTPGAVLSISGLNRGPLRGVHVDVHAGQILGVTGLLGSGRTTLLRTMFGDGRSDASVEIGGRLQKDWSLAQAMRNGVAFVPEDRAGDALFPLLTVRENQTIAALPRFVSRMRLSGAKERDSFIRMRHRLRIKAASPELPIMGLSGGNQQKVVLARWLERSPSVILLDEPTQGVDAMARADIYAELRAMAESGSAVVVASSDLEEIANLCDRVIVLRGGRVVADLSHEQATIAAIIELSSGTLAAPRDVQVSTTSTPSYERSLS